MAWQVIVTLQRLPKGLTKYWVNPLGNLDPATLFASPEHIRQQAHLMLQDAYSLGDKTGYIANLGHGINQWVNPDHAKAFIDAVHEYKL